MRTAIAPIQLNVCSSVHIIIESSLNCQALFEIFFRSLRACITRAKRPDTACAVTGPEFSVGEVNAETMYGKAYMSLAYLTVSRMIAHRDDDLPRGVPRLLLPHGLFEL